MGGMLSHMCIPIAVLLFALGHPRSISHPCARPSALFSAPLPTPVPIRAPNAVPMRPCAGLAEMLRIEKMRAKRAFEATLPPLDDMERLPLRQKMIEEWEAKEWAEREKEIQGVQNERLALMDQAMQVGSIVLFGNTTQSFLWLNRSFWSYYIRRGAAAAVAVEHELGADVKVTFLRPSRTFQAHYLGRGTGHTDLAEIETMLVAHGIGADVEGWDCWVEGMS